jgi:RimJ/RimL family protein N-acetyltransferase
MNSDDARLFEHVRPWLERQLGFSIRAPDASVRVAEAPSCDGQHSLFAVRAGAAVAVAARQEWLDALRLIVEELHPDILFSIAGAYELSRVTLADEVWVFGPVAVYVADETAWRPVDDTRPRRLAAADLETVDWDTFWHCTGASALGHFGIYEDQRLVAMASVSDRGDHIWEIGMDAAPGAKGRGLGTAVVSAVGDFILRSGAIIYATTGHWNVPSGRSLRRLGMRYTHGLMLGMSGPFRVPPQALGEPLPGTPLYDYYPRWAMNKRILETPPG